MPPPTTHARTHAHLPGMTMSPSPSMAKAGFPSGCRPPRGNSSLMGPSKFLATDTITGVQKTQKLRTGVGARAGRGRAGGGACGNAGSALVWAAAGGQGAAAAPVWA